MLILKASALKMRMDKEEKSGKQGTHSFFVSEVSLYENPHADVTTDTKNHLGKTSSAGIVDAKLKNFFDFANGKLNIMIIKYIT